MNEKIELSKESLEFPSTGESKGITVTSDCEFVATANQMEKVTVKIELDRDDISAMMHLLGSKLSNEHWDKMKGKEYTMCDEDMEDQAVQMKLAFSAIAVSNLLKDNT